MTPEYYDVCATLDRVRAQHGIPDADALVLALTTNLGTHNGKSGHSGVIGGYDKATHASVAALVEDTMRRSDGDVARATLMSCEYLRFAHYLTDRMLLKRRKTGRGVSPSWSTVLTLLISDTERLDVVDHLSTDGVIPVELVAAMYLD